jgi:hypothetical protein
MTFASTAANVNDSSSMIISMKSVDMNLAPGKFETSGGKRKARKNKTKRKKTRRSRHTRYNRSTKRI